MKTEIAGSMHLAIDVEEQSNAAKLNIAIATIIGILAMPYVF